MINIKETASKLLQGCIIYSINGVKMYTPDGAGRYAAHWTRDFSYMVEDAGDLIPTNDIKNGIQYIIDGAREDGWMPDRVDTNGEAWYTAGGRNELEALPNLDNGCFLCFLADDYLKKLDREKAIGQFKKWKSALCKGLDCLPVAKNGIVDNSSNPPHSPFGFTDTVRKTGLLCMETLLLWRAKRKMIFWLNGCGYSTKKYEQDCRLIERSFTDVFLKEDGMFRAATQKCDQTDIWATCYAVSIGFPLSDDVKYGIADRLIKNYESITESGQLRHLPAGEFWEDTFVKVPEGTYQNGAFWATPVKWFYDALCLRDINLARKTVKDALSYFEKYGVFECVNGNYKQLDTYVASATAIYGACKKDSELKNLIK